MDTNHDLPAVGIRELRGALADVVSRADAGLTTIITSHGKPVAQLGPVSTDGPTLTQLIASGAIAAPRRHADDFRVPTPTTIWAGTRIDQALRDVRG